MFYSIVAFDEKGRATKGVFVSPLGVRVQIHKTWINIEDPRCWRKGGLFERPKIMQVHQGRVTYRDVHIQALRGTKDGVYVAVWAGSEYDRSLTGMIGIGCLNYLRKGRFVGISMTQLQFLSCVHAPWEMETPETLRRAVNHEKARVYRMRYDETYGTRRPSLT